MGNFWKIAGLVVGGVIVADILIHPAGVKAVGGAGNTALGTTGNALLGKTK
jgi:hypothetical protein